MNKAMLATIIALLIPFSIYAKPKPRVYVSGSGNTDVRHSVFGSGLTANNHNQTMEVAEDLLKTCPDSVTVTMNSTDFDYTITLNHEAFNGILAPGNNQIMITNHQGDLLNVHKTHSVQNAVKDACAVISTDWSAKDETK